MEQKNFQAQIRQILEKRCCQDHRPVKIMAQDEGRFGRISDTRKAWAPKDINIRLPVQIVRKYFYVYAAVEPITGDITALILPYANIEIINIFLKQVSEDFSDYFIFMQLDKAGWHRSKELVVPENIQTCLQPGI